MKTITTLGLLTLVGTLLSGCATTAPTTSHASTGRHFHEAKTADAVLQFSSWDYTFLTQPRYDDNGFLLPVTRENLSQVLSQMNVQKHDLAVVVLGWSYTPEQLGKLVAEWKTILGGCGFQRVVVLKSSGSKQVDGSLVIDDSTTSGATTPSITQL